MENKSNITEERLSKCNDIISKINNQNYKRYNL